MVDIDARQRFQRYLLAGERILWSGQPRQGLALRAADLGLIPFSLMWGGFAIFWNATVWTTGAPWFFTLWGIPFLVIGLYIIAGRFVHDAMARRRQYYAVTDRRVLFLQTLFGPRFQSIEIGHLPMLELEESRGGRGTISFDSAYDMSLFGRRRSWGLWVPALAGASQFFSIDQPRNVYEMIQRQSDERLRSLGGGRGFS
jgi:hypothetical protein